MATTSMKYLTELYITKLNITKPSEEIIEVKKPPLTSINFENVSPEVFKEDSDYKKTVEEKTETGPANFGDTGCENISRVNSSKIRNPPYVKDNKMLKSSIPRFTKIKANEKVNAIPDKRLTSGSTRIPKSSCPSKSTQMSVVKTTRLRPNSICSRPMTPSNIPFSLSTNNNSKVTASETPGQRNKDQKELDKLFKDMYANFEKHKVYEGISNNNEKIVKEDKKAIKLDYIMHSKDEETSPKINTTTKPNPEIPPPAEKVIVVKNELFNLDTDFSTLSSKADVLQSLSELNGFNQTNLKELHTMIKQIIKSVEDPKAKSIEMQFYSLEQSQIELIQKLARTVSMFFDEKETLKKENAEITGKIDAATPKLAKLEIDNQNLLEELKVTKHYLEEERVIGQKKKISSQNFAQTKSRVQKAEGKIQNMESKTNSIISAMQKLEASLKQKESIFEGNMKKIKLLESTIRELEIENQDLQGQLTAVKLDHEEKRASIVRDSTELKEAKDNLERIQAEFRNEIERREKSSAQLQETTERLKSMEVKCKNLTTMLDNVKKESKAKESENTVITKSLKEEIQQLKTEVDARKVMVEIAENEILLTKNKLNKMESQLKQDHLKEKEINSIEEQLRMELALRDEQITQLQEQIKSLIERRFGSKEPKSKRGKTPEKITGNNNFNERIALTAQVVELERDIDNIAKENLQLNQLLNRKNLELDQRDRILKMQTEVLKIRDELIYLLKSKEAKHEEDIKRLHEIIQERENAIAKEWNKAIGNNSVANQGKSGDHNQVPEGNQMEEKLYLTGTMYELYSELERKQMELEMMHQRVQHLEGMQEAYNQQRTRQEARISKLEMALSEKCLDDSGLVPILAQ